MTDSPFVSRNPFDGRLVEQFDTLPPDAVEAAVRGGDHAQRDWAATDLAERAAVLAATADVLEARAADLAATLALEMGKPVTQGRAEMVKSASLCRQYSAAAASALSPTAIDGVNAQLRFDPIGIVLGVMPWNYPVWQTLRFAVPSLLLGNGVILKPAPNVVRTCRALADVLSAAGLPDGVFQTLLLGESQTLDLIRHEPLIAAVTLTGSGRAGRAIAAAAGEGLKKSVLELGGSDPFVVLADADIEAAAATAVASRTQNAGQSCIAAKRFIVEEPVMNWFLDAFVAALSDIQLGDPADESTTMGPLARADARDRLHDQVRASVDTGARLLVGGKLPDGPGYGYSATVLTDVTADSPVWQEETFGPVAAIRVAADEDDALQLANDSHYGLGASVWTGDAERAQQFAAELRSGLVTVNDMVRSDPRIPFGGVKESGYGRELGTFGWHEFANIKAVQVAG